MTLPLLVVVIAVGVSWLTPAEAHICMIWPPQRGGWNAFNAPAGDDHCFQPVGPCGTKPSPSAPTDYFYGGTTIYIILQQNLNHYNPGWPGFIDVAYAVGPNASDSSFIPLATVPDYWAHAQSAQKNFSIPFIVPSVTCDWCTLRVRYHPNKPTEPIFHNCGDIQFLPPPTPPSPSLQLFGFLAPSSETALSSLVEISLAGVLTPTSLSIDILKRDQPPLDYYFAEGIVAVDSTSTTVYFIGDTLQNFGQQSPRTLFRYTDHLEPLGPLKTSGLQWNSLIDMGQGRGLVGVQQQHTEGYLFAYIVSYVSYLGVVTDIGMTSTNDTFVNFFWAAYDPTTKNTYILSGDENSLYALNVVLYTVDSKGASSSVFVDNSKYTISNVYVDTTTGILYAVSPGLFGEYDWSIVIIDPKTGSVTLQAKIDNGNRFESWYGGGVYNGLLSTEGKLVYTFRWRKTGAIVVVLIDIRSGNISYQTDISLGVNSLHKLTSIYAVTPR